MLSNVHSYLQRDYVKEIVHELRNVRCQTNEILNEGEISAHGNDVDNSYLNHNDTETRGEYN